MLNQLLDVCVPKSLIDTVELVVAAMVEQGTFERTIVHEFTRESAGFLVKAASCPDKRILEAYLRPFVKIGRLVIDGKTESSLLHLFAKTSSVDGFDVYRRLVEEEEREEEAKEGLLGDSHPLQEALAHRDRDGNLPLHLICLVVTQAELVTTRRLVTLFLGTFLSLLCFLFLRGGSSSSSA